MNAISRIIQDLQRVAVELGKTPSESEYFTHGRFSETAVKASFKSFDIFLKSAGLVREKLKPVKFKYKQKKIESIKINEVDLKELFRRAGNPSTLKVLVQPDTHLKFVDPKAIKVFMKFGIYYEPHVHIILGDFLDAEGISHWPSSDLEPRRFIPEVKEGRAFLAYCRSVFKNVIARFFIEGNHEDWLNQAMAAKLPELFDGLDELGLMPNIEALLDFKNLGYELIKLNEFLRIGSANFSHGTLLGPNHSKKHLDAYKQHFFYGHAHDDDDATTTSLNGTMESASFCCLCRLDAKFLKGKINNWTHGFGTIEFTPDGEFTRVTHKIKNGRMSYNGKLFEA